MEDRPTHMEQELFSRIALGDEQAFGEIFHAYTARLFPTVIKIVKSEPEAEEIIQEVFLRLWLRRADLRNILNPGAWLHTVAANLSLTSLRRQAREHRRIALVTNDPVVEEDLVSQLDMKQLKTMVEEAVSKLPPSRRAIFMLSRAEGLSRREIAGKLGISESTVKNQLTAALRFVQDYLDRKIGILVPCYVIFISVLKK
jgi:RNA polymerase sigma-70 factor (family 1)